MTERETGAGRPGGRRGLVARLAGPALARPWLVLGVWLAAVALLGVLGRGVGDRLATSTLEVAGTESARAITLYGEEFGASVTVPVLLRGEPGEIERQGPALVAALRSSEGIRVLSPWDSGEGTERLRPEPGAAMLVTQVSFEEGELDEAGRRVRNLVDEEVTEPVTAHLSGLPIVGLALRDESVSSARQAERIAIPLLIIVLLLVFRSPIAAAVPAIFGIATIVAGSGILYFLAGRFEIDVIALSLASMMGLALGVDYSLLLVSRFREELARGADPPAAAAATAATAGRTVLFAGLTLVLAMAVALLLAPADVLLSAATGVIVVGTWSVLGTMIVTPAALVLLGPRVNALSFGLGAGAAVGGTGAWAAIAGVVLRRPMLASLPALLALLILAVPAFGLDSGPPDVRELPPGSDARQDYEILRETMGPGWEAPFEVIAAADRGTITTERRLAALERWEDEVASDERVASVIGPGAVGEQASEVREAGEQLEEAPEDLREAERGLHEVQSGLRRAGLGMGRLQDGLQDAALLAGAVGEGAGLAGGQMEDFGAALGQAADGAALLAWGLEEARDGAELLAAGARRAYEGAERSARAAATLARGIGAAQRGVAEGLPATRMLAEELERGARDLERLREPAEETRRALDDVVRELEAMTVGRLDPRYPTALAAALRGQAAVTGRNPITGQRIDPDYPGLPEAIARAAEGVAQAAAGARELAERSAQLSSALGQLADGAGRLAQGLEELRRGLATLSAGNRTLARELGSLAEGAAALAEGMDQFAGGTGGFGLGLDRMQRALGELAAGLSEGEASAGQLAHGVDRARGGQARITEGLALGETAERIEELGERSPRLFDSGHFVLAVLDGAPARDRDRAAYAVSLDRGGRAGRVLVVPEEGPNHPQTRGLRHDLSDSADRLGEGTGTETAVGGQGALLADFDEETTGSLLVLILALTVVTWIVLIPIFRALLLPAIGVLLNLLTVGVAFGVLAILFGGEDPIMGGPGFVNAVALSAIFAVIFALSIDYQVFIVSRMRESYDRHRDGDRAVRYGLERTAGVVTGAAAIMAGVFIAFSFTDVATTRQAGIGLTVAVLLDATVVRLLLLPAAIRLGGPAVWWLPAALERRIPTLDHGSTSPG